MSALHGIEKIAGGWRLKGGNLVLDIEKGSGNMKGLVVKDGEEFVWTEQKGEVSVYDDRMERRFSGKDVKNVRFELKEETLVLYKSFKDAPWMLTEKYRVEDDTIHWTAQLEMDKGDFRSCSIVYSVPWPQPAFRISLWAAKENMPSQLNRFGGFAFEYGEITSGILIPALCAYRKDKKDAGILLTMPFDFKTPRFRFVGGYRDPSLNVRYDWLALKAKKPANASLLLRASSGGWRPSLGWLYQRFNEYFEPRSSLIHKLWGGHVCGGSHVPLKKARIMAELGLKWHEIHGHFPLYGNYHPEVEEWTSGHYYQDKRKITVGIIKRSIKTLHSVGSAALPYIQVSGDGDDKLPEHLLRSSLIRDIYGEKISAWRGTHLMNSDPSLPFGKDVTRQIKGMAARYPEMDGVFLDQACYNFLDTAHSDGITAVNNRPAYMSGLNYLPHLELLSQLLHPEKVIIGNGPFGIGLMKYIDGFMAEGSGWLCGHMQYYALAKPMFFLVYDRNDRAIEKMFQSCLVYGSGYTSYPEAFESSKDIYELYTPLLQLLYRRRWVFDSNPIEMPVGFQGNLFVNPEGNLVASIVSDMERYPRRRLAQGNISINSKGVNNIRRVVLNELGEKPKSIPFSVKNSNLQFDIPGKTVSAVAELHREKI